jgi:hypothetical protein
VTYGAAAGIAGPVRLRWAAARRRRRRDGEVRVGTRRIQGQGCLSSH